MRIRLDRTVCDGFGICARQAPAFFSLDDWGYASRSASLDHPLGQCTPALTPLTTPS